MKKESGINYLILVVLAFASVGLELLLAFGAEPVLYGGAISQWTDMQNIMRGIIVAVTWGIGHFFTKDVLTGIVTVISGLAFGSVYLLANRDIRKTYLILFIMFVL